MKSRLRPRGYPTTQKVLISLPHALVERIKLERKRAQRQRIAYNVSSKIARLLWQEYEREDQTRD